MPEEVPDRALANKLLEYHGGQATALYSVGSCIYANKHSLVTLDTVNRAVKELRDFAVPGEREDVETINNRNEAAVLAIKLAKWGERRSKITPFIIAYIDAALWSSSCNETDNDDTSLSERYSMADIEDASIEQIIRECNDFISQCKPEDLELQTDDQNGHDFWLTRSRHGCGFWDRGLGEAGKRLTDIAHSMGSSDVYVGDEGKLYFT